MLRMRTGCAEPGAQSICPTNGLLIFSADVINYLLGGGIDLDVWRIRPGVEVGGI